MKKYTDEQLRRVAEKVGWNYFSMRDDAIARRPKGSSPNQAMNEFHRRLHKRLLSPEGRCAIEDKIIETEFDVGTFKNYKGAYEVHVNGDDAPDEKEFIFAEAPTPAEAWLDAGMKISGGKK